MRGNCVWQSGNCAVTVGEGVVTVPGRFTELAETLSAYVVYMAAVRQFAVTVGRRVAAVCKFATQVGEIVVTCGNCRSCGVICGDSG